MTRPAATRTASDVLADLAALASDEARIAARRAHLHGELAAALRDASTPAPAADAPEYLTTEQAARLLGVNPKALAAMRGRGAGPQFVRVGRAVRYPRAALRQK